LLVEQNTTPDLCVKYANRLAHVHAHDNKGGSGDLHLPIGAGNVDWPTMIRALKRANYNNTITLEVFTDDRHYLGYSRDRLRELWNEVVV
jgi:sugar phosphate isomerase/epimerase